MSIRGEIEKDSQLILHHKKIGYVRAWAEEKPQGLGGSAYFRVGVNSVNLPGVSEAVINVNTWDVWRADDPKILEKIAKDFVKAEWER